MLKQILIWSTFADQLSGEHQRDRELLNEVHAYLMKALATKAEERLQVSAIEDDICWKILFVGWDFFCRTTFQ